MVPKIVEIDAKKLVGIRSLMSLGKDATPQLWQGFMPRRGEVANRIDDRYLCVRSYQEMGPMMFDVHTEFQKWAAVEVSAHGTIPQGMEPLSISAGRYAVFEHRGPASTFGETMGYIFGVWLPSSGYELDHREHFEVLEVDYRPHNPDAREAVWVPLK